MHVAQGFLTFQREKVAGSGRTILQVIFLCSYFARKVFSFRIESDCGSKTGLKDWSGYLSDGGADDGSDILFQVADSRVRDGRHLRE